MSTFDDEIKGIIFYLSVKGNSTHHQQNKRTYDMEEVQDPVALAPALLDAVRRSDWMIYHVQRILALEGL